MTRPENIVQIEMGTIENVGFIVMPFDSLFQVQYERVLRPAIEELGLKCVRGDEIYSKPQIMSDIWTSIRRARLVVAELTGRNANVFYEIGLAHALGKPIILLTRNEDDVPFDLKSLRYRYYNVDDPFWGENLRSSLQTMVSQILEQPDFPTYLEGITSELKLPRAPVSVNLSLRSQSISHADISGDWKVNFTISSAVPEDKLMAEIGVQHQGVIHITQEKENLSAIMTLSFELRSVISVVQEMMTGTIRDSRVQLDGVSYTYVHQGNSESYSPDSFSLDLSPDSTKLAGTVSFSGGTGKVILIR